jgi:hypothetical protein
MTKRIAYTVKLRQKETGEEHNRLIFAESPETAGERAIVRARSALGKTMAEREYGQYEVLSCALAPPTARTR